MVPECLVIGHIVKDMMADGSRIGGCVAYAARQAARLGLSTAAVTACAADLDPSRALPEVRWHVLPSPLTTTFENRYEAGRRRQRLLAFGSAIAMEDIPSQWLQAPLILLGPVFRELAPGLAPALCGEGRLLGVAAQGWLRECHGSELLPWIPRKPPEWLAAGAVFLSEEDIADEQLVLDWAGRTSLLVITRGSRGCTVWQQSARQELPAFSVCEVDPTGAGDVFAASFLVRLRETGDAVEAGRFASAAAALSVQGKGTESVADRQAIEALLAAGDLRATTC